jgi:hypothetical protein
VRTDLLYHTFSIDLAQPHCTFLTSSTYLPVQFSKRETLAHGISFFHGPSINDVKQQTQFVLSPPPWNLPTSTPQETLAVAT